MRRQLPVLCCLACNQKVESLDLDTRVAPNLLLFLRAVTRCNLIVAIKSKRCVPEQGLVYVCTRTY